MVLYYPARPVIHINLILPRWRWIHKRSKVTWKERTPQPLSVNPYAYRKALDVLPRVYEAETKFYALFGRFK